MAAKPNISFLSKEKAIEIGNTLDVHPACIMAVAEVESPKGPYLPDGRVTILFEAAVFWSEIIKKKGDPKKYHTAHPNVLSPTWVKTLYKGGAAEYSRLAEAAAIDGGKWKEAAYRACSWGQYQIMGFNAGTVGFKDVFDMAEKMKQDVEYHHQAFIGYIKAVPMCMTGLKKKDWDKFAYAYNGPNYKKNRYDSLIAAAYQKYKKLFV